MECLGQISDPCPESSTAASCGLLLVIMQTLMHKTCSIATKKLYPESYTPKLKNGDEFDFIVVGAGSAGSVVASRLSENPKWKVLVIEAGDYPSIVSDMPLMFPNLFQTKEDWDYQPEKSPGVGALVENGAARWPRGKMVGGTSAINAMLYLRGNKKDYDSWEELGNPGWSYEALDPYFKKIENVKNVIEKDRDKLLLGSNGQVLLTQNEIDPLDQIIANSIPKMGYEYHNQEVTTGYFIPYNNIDKGIRQSASKAYIADVQPRNNLYIATKTQASRLLFDEDKCIGVEIITEDECLQIYTKKEVIVSAGSINSPQLLMHSGIGPKSHLEAHNIKVLKNLPVGKNLQDHVLSTSFLVKLSSTVNVNNEVNNMYNYLMNREGPMNSTNLLVGLINTKGAEQKFPDVQILHMNFKNKNSILLNSFLKSFSLNEKFRADAAKANREYGIQVPLLVLLNPKSTGEILLKSKDPLDKPLIYPKYFEKEEDLDVLVRGVRYYQRMLKTEIFSDYNAGMAEIEYEMCDGFEYDSDEWWKCAIKATATTLYHPVGTCRMGPESDPASVVDHELKVHGVKSLRVVDGSIMPNIVSVNTNAACMMIGEKGADMIRNSHLG